MKEVSLVLGEKKEFQKRAESLLKDLMNALNDQKVDASITKKIFSQSKAPPYV